MPETVHLGDMRSMRVTGGFDRRSSLSNVLNRNPSASNARRCSADNLNPAAGEREHFAGDPRGGFARIPTFEAAVWQAGP